MKNILTKIIKRPITNQTVEVETIQLWYVRWKSRHSDYMGDAKTIMEAFTSEDDAKFFKESLENAFKLLKYSGSITKVSLEKAK